MPLQLGKFQIKLVLYPRVGMRIIGKQQWGAVCYSDLGLLSLFYVWLPLCRSSGHIRQSGTKCYLIVFFPVLISSLLFLFWYNDHNDTTWMELTQLTSDSTKYPQRSQCNHNQNLFTLVVHHQNNKISNLCETSMQEG